MRTNFPRPVNGNKATASGARLLLLLLLLALPVAVHAQFTYTTNNGAITITRYTGADSKVTIPGTINGLPVTTIGESAFSSCTSLTNVTIPSSVTVIDSWAFTWCLNLTSVTIPKGVTTIAGGAFATCVNLTGITIPDSVTTIGGTAFYDCRKLTCITIPGNVNYLGPDAFYSCNALTNVTIDGAITSIERETFYDCWTLASVTVPSSVRNIGDAAFVSCYVLSSITIPESVTNIGRQAFFGCDSLTTITIPSNVATIGVQAMSRCAKLTAIQVDPSNPTFVSDKGVLYQKLQKTLIQFPNGKSGSYTIPNWTTSIGFLAASYGQLTSITVPRAVSSIGDYAFQYCYALTDVYFEGNSPSASWGVLYYANAATVYVLPGATGWGETFGTRPTALWLPRMLTPDASFGVGASHFGFNVAWASGQTVAVEACLDLANPAWVPLQTNTIPTNGFAYFSDPTWTNYPSRLYRIRSP